MKWGWWREAIEFTLEPKPLVAIPVLAALLPVFRLALLVGVELT